MKILHDDLIRFQGRTVKVMSVIGATVLFRYLEGGCDAAPLADVEFVSRPRKVGAHFRNYVNEVPYYAIPTKSGERIVSVIEIADTEYEIPETPDHSFWRTQVELKRRCGLCWRVIRTKADADKHALTHQISLPSDTPARPANLRMKGEHNGKR